MIAELKSLIESTNSNYIVEFEESKMMNVKVDEYPKDAKFAYIEEYLQGKYTVEQFRKKKSIQVQIYFCAFTDLDNTASEREAIRNTIESEMILPLIDKLRNTTFVDKNAEISFYNPVPRFDAHEVSMMLQFDYKKVIC